MTEREIIKEKVLQIAEMHGLKFQDGKLIRDFNTLNIINFSNGIVQRVLEDDHDTIPQFIDVMYSCLEKFFKGDLGKYEEYEEDIYHMSQGTPKGKYLIEQTVATIYGNCNTVCVIPRTNDICVCMEMEN